MEKTLYYNENHPTRLLNSILYNSSERKKAVVLVGLQGAPFAVLEGFQDPSIQEGEAVVSSWLQIHFSTFIKTYSATAQVIEHENVVDTYDNVKFHVKFLAQHRQAFSWHENLDNDLYLSSNTVSWPSHINISLLQKLIVIDSNVKYIGFGMAFAIQYLESVLVFECVEIILNGEKFYNIVKLSKDRNKIQIVINHDLPENAVSARKQLENSVCMIDSRLKCAYQPFESLISICVGASISLRDWNGPRSIALTGLEGSGKSYVLNALFYHLQSETNIVPIKISMSTFKSSSTTKNSNNWLQTDLLDKLISLFDINSNSILQINQLKAHDCANDKLIVIIIDDMDLLFKRYLDSMDIASNESFIHPIAEAGFLFQALLKSSSRHVSLSIETNSLPLILIGATRLRHGQLPPQSHGFPTFDTEITIPKPTLQDRVHIISTLLCNNVTSNSILEKLDDNNSIDTWATRLSALTGGYLPGDLLLLISRVFYYWQGHALTSKLENFSCQWKFALKALTMTPPKQLERALSIGSSSSTYSSSKSLSWDDFCGYDDVKDKLRKLLNRLHNEEPKNSGTSQVPAIGVKGIVLYGPSGSGKSYLASIIAAEAKANFVSVKGPEVLSKYFSESETRIRQLFQSARASAPCVLFFDEFDAVAYKRDPSNTSEGSNSLNSRILSTFLNELDGIAQTGEAVGASSGVLVVISCQDLSRIDEALLRVGRLQHHIALRLPSREDILAMIASQVFVNNGSSQLSGRKIICDSDVTFTNIVDLIYRSNENPTGATVHGFCKNAVLNAIREYIESSEDEQLLGKELHSSNAFTVSYRHFERAAV